MKHRISLAALLCALVALTSCCRDGSGRISSRTVSDGTAMPVLTETPEGGAVPDGKTYMVEEGNTPEIRLLSRGSILPSTGQMDLLFSSRLYASAQIRINKVHKTNVMQFMQSDMDRWNLEYVSTRVADTTIVLGARTAPYLRQEKTYGFSLDEIIKPDPGSIYHVEIRGREPLEDENFYDSEWAFGDYRTYDERSVNLLASDITLIAKKSDEGVSAVVMNILTGKPVPGVKVRAYSFVQQEISKAVSGRDGKVTFRVPESIRFLIATDGRQYAYMDLRPERSLPTSGFDVGGAMHEGGLQAYIFGERGVWRPGDTMHVCAVTAFETPLPPEHPVSAELRDPSGHSVQTITERIGTGNIHHFPFVTQKDSPTGRWSVIFTVGDRTFSKTLRVETIRPNRLDIGLDFGRPYITADKGCIGTISVNWLYGAVGSGLKVDGEYELSTGATGFKGYEDYDFKDDARAFKSTVFTFRNLVTDAEGHAAISTGSAVNRSEAQGFLDAGFTIRAYEPSGEFSTAYHGFRMSPFETYVGLKTVMDKDKWGGEFLQAGKKHRFDIVTLDPDGRGKKASVKAEIYLVDWTWWWSASEQIADYMAGSGRELLFSADLSSSEGRCSFSYDWKDAPSGLYYIRVTDTDGGHASSLLCNVDDSSGNVNVSDAAARLSLSVGKESYSAGETARIIFPSSAGTTAFVSIEKGGKILSSTKVACQGPSTEISVPVTSGMAPNAYAFITLVQPHGNVDNDAPIRLYGIANINVEAPETRLNPVLDAPARIKPEGRLQCKVSEKDGRPMEYVVAIVDEGLLSLTGYRTPDAWKAFYAKEALRVRTWDSYDEVIGAYGGQIEKLFAIGGDGEAETRIRQKGVDRFPPVVSFIGPCSLKAGRTATHNIEIPQYIGTLRAMVIATDGRSQGSTACGVNVSKPLMVQASFPRSVSCGEVIKVPVTVLAMEDNVGKVKLSARTEGGLSVSGPSSITVNAGKSGQQVEYFEVDAGPVPGSGSLTITAESTSDKSVCSVDTEIHSPNPQISRSVTTVAGPAGSVTLPVSLFGKEGTNHLKVELSSIPAINLQRRLNYLLEYPFGCLEQTVSAAFPQLYIDKVMECEESVRTRSERNVSAAIRRIQNFRMAGGGLSYWPGEKETSAFGTAYALHFLQEAENRGYAVPADLRSELIRFVSSSIVNDNKENPVTRAYGTFALAASGKPQRGAMNSLRDNLQNLPHSAAWLLAAAFACDGKNDVALQICNGLPYAESEGGDYGPYGSYDRNLAVALHTMLLTGREQSAFEIASQLAENLNSQSHFMSTQSTAWALYAMNELACSGKSDGVNATIGAFGSSLATESDKSITINNIKIPSGNASKDVVISVTNNGKGPIHATATVTGVPEAGEETAYSHGITLDIKYCDRNGIPVDLNTMERGTVLTSVVTVTNCSPSEVRDIALTQRFPSGWEIHNRRIYDGGFSYPPGIEYQDFRDDRVLSFFSLEAGKSVRLTTEVTTTYPGRFYLPSVVCEAMYDETVGACIPGRWIELK